MSQHINMMNEKRKSHAPSKWRGTLRMLIRYRVPILIGMAFYRLIGLGFSEMQQGGESIFALRVQTILRFGDLWDQSPHMLSGISHAMHPPLYVWLSASSVLMFGDVLWVYRLPSALAGAALVILLYRFARMSMSTVRALIVAGLFTFAPLPAFLSRQGLPDILLAFTAVAALYFSWHAIRARSAGAMLLAGIALGAALLTQPAFAFAVPVAITAAGALFPRPLRTRAWRAALIITLISLPVWLPWYWSMTTTHGDGELLWLLSSVPAVSEFATGDYNAAQPAGFLPLLLRLLILLTVLFPFVLYFLWTVLYERRRPLWILVAVFALCVFTAEWIWGSLTEVVFIPLFPLLIYAGVHGWRFARPPGRRLRAALSVPTLLVILALLAVYTMQHIWRVDPVTHDDGARRAVALLRTSDAERILLVGNGDNPQLTWQLRGANIGWLDEERLRYEPLEPFALGVQTIRERAEAYADTMRVAMLIERDEITRGEYREAAEVLPPNFTLHLQTRRYIVAGSRSVRWLRDSNAVREQSSLQLPHPFSE